jgi:hypothetical protein
MANAVLFIGWNRPFLGKEESAYSYLFERGLPYLRGLCGRAFERLELIGLTAHRSDLNSFILLLGQRAELDALRRTDEFESFIMNMNGLFDRLGVVPGINEEGISAMLARKAKVTNSEG